MTKKTMIAGAAIAGLMSGSFAVTAHAVQSSSRAGVSLEMGKKTAANKHACAGLNSCKGQGADGKNECKGKGSCATYDKHACAGKNSCKGQGAGGKNECKGKGSCQVPPKPHDA